MECFMDVYWGKNFWYDGTEGAPLNKIPVYETAAGAPLAWGNKNLYIPAIYVGQEGVVLDLCMRVPLSDISALWINGKTGIMKICLMKRWSRQRVNPRIA